MLSFRFFYKGVLKLYVDKSTRPDNLYEFAVYTSVTVNVTVISVAEQTSKIAFRLDVR